MDYKVFEQLSEDAFKKKYGENMQAYMEHILTQVFLTELDDGKEHIYDKMGGRFAGCDYKSKVAEAEFFVREWELNSIQTMHGGLIATAVDITCGVLVRFFKRSGSAATVQLSVDYLKPLSGGEGFIVRAKINKQGRRIIFLTAEVISKDSGQTAATASGVFV